VGTRCCANLAAKDAAIAFISQANLLGERGRGSCRYRLWQVSLKMRSSADVKV
jgi:hypothetical protein